MCSNGPLCVIYVTQQTWPTRGSTSTLSCPCWSWSTPSPRVPTTTMLRVCASSTRRATAQSWAPSCALCCPPWVSVKSPSPNIEAHKYSLPWFLTWIFVQLQERRWMRLRLMPLWPARRTRTVACTMRVSFSFPSMPCLLVFTNVERETFEHTRSCFCSFRQAHHVCVRGQQLECWRTCSSPTDSLRCSGHLHCFKDQPRKDKDYVQGMLKQTHLVVYFVFLCISSQALLSRDIVMISPM